MILQKILLGVTLAAPIGPVSAEMIRRGLKSGFWASFNIRLGGAVGNSLCLLAAFFGLGALKAYPWVFIALGLLGSGLLLYMAYKTLMKVFKPITGLQASSDEAQSHPLLQSLMLGFLLAILSPVGVVFWLSIFANDLDPTAPISLHHLFLNFNIIVGVLLWGAFLSGMLAIGRKGLSPRMMQMITAFSGVVLLYFGIKYGAQNLLHLYG